MTKLVLTCLGMGPLGCAFLFNTDALPSETGPVTDAADAGGLDAPAPSCSTLGPITCGTSHESCCASPELPAGTYYRTYTNTGGAPTNEADPATVSALRLDMFLVTVGRFRQFASAWAAGAGYLPAEGSGKHHLSGDAGLSNSGASGTYEPGWSASDDHSIQPTTASLGSCSPYSTWTSSPGTQETLPITCVNWWEAYAFCIWDGGFLPSEAEWEYAAAGGDQEREYSWGTADPGRSSQYEILGCNYPNPSGTCTGIGNIAPVGTAPDGAGKWGQMDLAGELWEWVLDWHADYVSPCTDCAYVANSSITGASERADRGGDFGFDTQLAVPPPYRDSTNPGTRAGNMGFRCARPP